MSPTLHRITTLAAVLAASRAERLLSFVAGAGAGEASAHACELARRTRHDRLAALASAWDGHLDGDVSASVSSRAALFLRLVRDASRLRGRPGAAAAEVRVFTRGSAPPVAHPGD